MRIIQVIIGLGIGAAERVVVSLGIGWLIAVTKFGSLDGYGEYLLSLAKRGVVR